MSFLKDVWYMGATSQQVKTGGMKSLVIMNEPIVLFRNSENKVSALRDICPHRGIPLSYGKVVNDQVECPYHGWKFSGDGVCREIPSLCADQVLDVTKIKVRTYPVLERQGMIWVFVSDQKIPDTSKSPEPPVMPAFPMDGRPELVKVARFRCHIDHAVIGLMDPAHGPYVHKSWLWRSEKTVLEKRKKFSPVPHGFRMVKHKPSANSKAYKMLGKEISTEITFTLPGVRIEQIQVGAKTLCAVTLLTPVSENETVIHQLMYWNLPWLVLLKPFLKWFTTYFLGQDIRAVEMQQEGLKYDPSLMLIRDADTQAKWYYALKEEWTKHLLENRTFENPVKETELDGAASDLENEARGGS